MDSEEIKHTIRSHLDTEGRLLRYPSKRKQQICAAFYLATRFLPGVFYTEKEVNELLLKWHIFGDPCTLRRDLCDLGLLGRERNGSRYWLETDPPSPEQYGLR